jgi:hypothetical protein
MEKSSGGSMGYSLSTNRRMFSCILMVWHGLNKFSL